MTSSSPEPRVVRGGHSTTVAVSTPDLGTGGWTRLGSAGVLGDAITEAALGGLAERARTAANAQGYAQGWAAGRRAGEAAARAQAEDAAAHRAADDDRRARAHAVAVQALSAASTELRARLDEACAAVEAHVVEVALQVAEAVLGRELAVATDPGADAVRRALTVLPADVTAFTLRLNPADLAALDSRLLDGHTVTVVADPTVARGDAVAETHTVVIDASVAAALGRVREVLA